MTAGNGVELIDQNGEGIGDRQGNHCKEDGFGPHTEQADPHRNGKGQQCPTQKADKNGIPANPERFQHDPDAIGANAVIHGMRKGNHTGIAEQQVEGSHQNDKNRNFCKHAHDRQSANSDRRQKHRHQQQHKHGGDETASGEITGKKRMDHGDNDYLFVRGNRPRGRQVITATRSMIVEVIAISGIRKAT